MFRRKEKERKILAIDIAEKIDYKKEYKKLKITHNELKDYYKELEKKCEEFKNKYVSTHSELCDVKETLSLFIDDRVNINELNYIHIGHSDKLLTKKEKKKLIIANIETLIASMFMEEHRVWMEQIGYSWHLPFIFKDVRENSETTLTSKEFDPMMESGHPLLFKEAVDECINDER